MPQFHLRDQEHHRNSLYLLNDSGRTLGPNEYVIVNELAIVIIDTIEPQREGVGHFTKLASQWLVTLDTRLTRDYRLGERIEIPGTGSQKWAICDVVDASSASTMQFPCSRSGDSAVVVCPIS